jgi:hypothetical protein
VPRFRADKKWRTNPWVQPIVARNPMRQTKAGRRSAFASEHIMCEGPEVGARKVERAGSTRIGAGWVEVGGPCRARPRVWR